MWFCSYQVQRVASLSLDLGGGGYRHSLHNPSLNCEFYTFCLQEVEPKTNNKLPSMQAGEQGQGPLRWPRGSGRPSEAGLSELSSAPITCSHTFPFLRPAKLRRTSPGSRPAWGQEAAGPDPPGRVDRSVGPAHPAGAGHHPPQPCTNRAQHPQPPRCPEETPALGARPPGALVLKKGLTESLFQSRDLPWKGTRPSPKAQRHQQKQLPPGTGADTRLPGCPPSRLRPEQLPGGLFNPHLTGQETEAQNEEPKPTQPGRGGRGRNPTQSRAPPRPGLYLGAPPPNPLPVPLGTEPSPLQAPSPPAP